MSTRQRTTQSSRKDPYGLWDSDSDRPRQTMASSQRHNADKTAVAEGSRKHRSSRRVDPSDPVAVHSYQQKSSSKDRTSAALQPSSYGVPQLSQPVTQRTQDGHTDAYSLRAYIRKKTDKRSPRSSNEKFPVGDDPYAPRQDYATATSYVQPSTSTHLYATPVEQKSRDPTSSSRYHRERDKDREKSSKRDAERSSTRDRTVETSEERERRRRKEKEAAREKERVSKDRDRHKEKERSKTRETRPTVDHRQADAASVYQAYGQSAAPAQRSADRLPSVYPEYGRAHPSSAVQATPVNNATAPWAGLTAGGRTTSSHTPAPAADTGYPSASDREEPPLPIPPPGHRRERSDSRTHRSRHQVLAQQGAQDSGISSSEQEQSGMDRARRYASREQASIIGRGHSSGPSGSENERPPTIQKERRKHRTQGESSRHKSKTTHADNQYTSSPTNSQEIASAWYQRHVRDVSATKQPPVTVDVPQRPPTTTPHDPVSTQNAMPPTGKPTPYVGLTPSHRPTPQIVSIRAGQGPSEPHAGTMLPKIPSATSVARQGEPQLADRTYDGTYRSQTAAQHNQQSAARHPESTPFQTAHMSTAHESSRAYQQQAYAIQGSTRGQQVSAAQGYSTTASHSRHAESSGATASATQGTQSLPDVVIRPPSAAPTNQDPYSSRDAAGIPPSHFGVQSGGRLQVPPSDPRSRSTPAPSQPAAHSHTAQASAQQVSYPQAYGSSQQVDASAYRSASTNGPGGAYQGSSHTKVASQDLPSKFPVYEDTPTRSIPAAVYGSQHSGSAYPSAAQTTNSRSNSSTIQGQSSASPKRNLTFPGASAPSRPSSIHVNSGYQSAGGYDPRSPKPPSMATLTPDGPSNRSHANGGHGRESSGQSAHRPSPCYDQQVAQLAADAYTTSHSPSHHHLPDPGRYPAAGHAASAGSVSGTPKHSPSSRLHSHRNGSNDTITHAVPPRPSPSSSYQQQLPPHNPSATTFQAHAASRSDNASASRQPNASSGYPDQVRYRSPAPPGYPTAQLPSSAPPDGPGTSHSQSHSTLTPNDYQYGRTSASAFATQTTYTSQYPGPSTHANPRTAQTVEYGHGPQDVSHSAPPTSTTIPISSQRAPPRTAAPPASHTRLTAVSSPPGKAHISLQSPPPQPTRHQTFPAPVAPAHLRTASDPQYTGKAGNAVYPSAGMTSRAQGQSRATAAAAAQQPDVLLTPSSLAPSMLPQVSSTVPLDRITSKMSTKDKDKEKHKGFFGISLFRSRSSPPKSREVEPSPSTADREKRQRNVSQPSQPVSYVQTSSVSVKPATGTPAPHVAVTAAVSIPASSRPTPQHQPQSQLPAPHRPQQQQQQQPHPQAQSHPQHQQPSQTQPQYQHQPSSQHQHRPQHQRGNNSLQVPIAAPKPIAASGERSPTGKMYTPFRLLSKKRRTVSAASVEAVEGTVLTAMLTGGDSTRSSTVGRPSPPLRDPLAAAYEWRNREEHDQQLRGTGRRRRPGVTFDVEEEVPEDGRAPVQKSFRVLVEESQTTLVPAQPSRHATA